MKTKRVETNPELLEGLSLFHPEPESQASMLELANEERGRAKKSRFVEDKAQRRGKRCRECGMPGDRTPFKEWHQRTLRGRETLGDTLALRCTVPASARVPGFPVSPTATLPRYKDYLFAVLLGDELVRPDDPRLAEDD